MSTVAEVIVQTLIHSGVERIYGLPGDSLNGITDSIRQHPELRWVHVRHEEVAAFAAGAEAHLTGRLAVCAGSCGPGNLHFINGLYDCHRSRVPVLAIAAQIPSSEIGTGLRLRGRVDDGSARSVIQSLGNRGALGSRSRRAAFVRKETAW